MGDVVGVLEFLFRNVSRLERDFRLTMDRAEELFHKGDTQTSKLVFNTAIEIRKELDKYRDRVRVHQRAEAVPVYSRTYQGMEYLQLPRVFYNCTGEISPYFKKSVD